MKRHDVYELIDGEREYQDNVGKERGWGAGVGALNHSVGDFLTLLQTYLARAHESYVSTTGDEAALDDIRKLAGIAVACMEQHGAPSRKI